MPVSATLLMPGAYQIGALFTSANDPNLFPTFTTGFSAASSDITYLKGASIAGASLTNPPPNFFYMGPAYFGPNFEFQSVPEPGSIALVGPAVFLALCVFRRTRRAGTDSPAL